MASTPEFASSEVTILPKGNDNGSQASAGFKSQYKNFNTEGIHDQSFCNVVLMSKYLQH